MQVDWEGYLGMCSIGMLHCCHASLPFRWLLLPLQNATSTSSLVFIAQELSWGWGHASLIKRPLPWNPESHNHKQRNHLAPFGLSRHVLHFGLSSHPIQSLYMVSVLEILLSSRSTLHCLASKAQLSGKRWSKRKSTQFFWKTKARITIAYNSLVFVFHVELLWFRTHQFSCCFGWRRNGHTVATSEQIERYE